MEFYGVIKNAKIGRTRRVRSVVSVISEGASFSSFTALNDSHALLFSCFKINWLANESEMKLFLCNS